MRRDRPTFVITFEPLPRVDGVRVLRGLLKTTLRRFGLRALDYREEHAVPTATQSGPWRGSDRAHTRATTEKTMGHAAVRRIELRQIRRCSRRLHQRQDHGS